MEGPPIRDQAPSLCELKTVIREATASMTRCFGLVAEAVKEFTEANEHLRDLEHMVASLDADSQWDTPQLSRHPQTDYVAALVDALAAIGRPARTPELEASLASKHHIKHPTFTKFLKRAWRESKIIKLPDGRNALPEWLVQSTGSSSPSTDK